MIVAISGPAASGKGTLARLLAKTLNLNHYDFGLMFRGIALLRQLYSEKVLQDLIVDNRLRVEQSDIWLCWVNLSSYLKSEEVGLLAARMAQSQLSEIIRLAMMLVKHSSFICDGRTCGSEIYPNAEFKFYITANEDERLQRRLSQGGQQSSYLERDHLDQNRLVIPNGAIILNTSGKTKEDCLYELMSYLPQKLNEQS